MAGAWLRAGLGSAGPAAGGEQSEPPRCAPAKGSSQSSQSPAGPEGAGQGGGRRGLAAPWALTHFPQPGGWDPPGRQRGCQGHGAARPFPTRPLSVRWGMGKLRQEGGVWWDAGGVGSSRAGGWCSGCGRRAAAARRCLWLWAEKTVLNYYFIFKVFFWPGKRGFPAGGWSCGDTLPGSAVPAEPCF